MKKDYQKPKIEVVLLSLPLRVLNYLSAEGSVVDWEQDPAVGDLEDID